MKVDLNKLEPLNIGNFDCSETISRPSHELEIEIDGKKYTVNADIDVLFDVYEECEGIHVRYTKTTIRDAYVLFNEAYDEDGNVYEFTGEEQTNIENQIKYDILL